MDEREERASMHADAPTESRASASDQERTGPENPGDLAAAGRRALEQRRQLARARRSRCSTGYLEADEEIAGLTALLEALPARMPALAERALVQLCGEASAWRRWGSDREKQLHEG